MELQQHGLRNVSTTTNQPIFKLRPLSPSTPAEARAFWDQGGSKSSARPWTPAFAARIGGMSLAGIGCFVCAHALPARTRHWWSTEGASDGWRLCSQGLLPHAPGVRGRVLRSSRAPRRNSISLPQHIGRRHVRIARRLGGKAHRLLRLAPRCAALAVCLPLALPFARPRQRPRAPRRQLRLEEDDFDAEAESEASAKRRGGGACARSEASAFACLHGGPPPREVSTPVSVPSWSGSQGITRGRLGDLCLAAALWDTDRQVEAEGERERVCYRSIDAWTYRQISVDANTISV